MCCLVLRTQSSPHIEAVGWQPPPLNWPTPEGGAAAQARWAMAQHGSRRRGSWMEVWRMTIDGENRHSSDYGTLSYEYRPNDTNARVRWISSFFSVILISKNARVSHVPYIFRERPARITGTKAPSRISSVIVMMSSHRNKASGLYDKRTSFRTVFFCDLQLSVIRNHSVPLRSRPRRPICQHAVYRLQISAQLYKRRGAHLQVIT